MNLTTIYNWMLPFEQDKRRRLLLAQRDEAIYRYGLALTIQHQMKLWLASFATTDDDWQYVYPLAFIQAWGERVGFQIKTHPTGQGTCLIFDNDLTQIKTKPIPSIDVFDNEFYQYPAGAVANPCEPELATDGIRCALNQLAFDVLYPYRDMLKRIAFGNDFYRDVLGYRMIDRKTDLPINNETTPWSIYTCVAGAMCDFESILAELLKTGGNNVPTRT